MSFKFIDRLDQFLFYTEDSRKAAVFRILLGIVLLLNFLLLWGNLETWFTSQGLFPSEVIQRRSHEFAASIFFWNDSLLFVRTCYAILLFATLLYTLGIYPRVCAFFIWILTVSFHNRNPELFHAGDMILRFVLFWNIFIDSSKAFSPFAQRTFITQVPGWPFRIIQIQVCIIYFFAAASKTNSQMWMSGEHAFAMLNFPGRGFFDFLWLRNFPAITSLLTYSIVAVELSFPFLVWFNSLRRWVIGAAFIMHLGIMLTINVIYFSEIMFVLLFAFIPLNSSNEEV